MSMKKSFSSLLSLLLLLLCSSSAIHANYQCVKDGLMPNGDFEWGPKQEDLKGIQVMGRYAIPKWEISGYVEYVPCGYIQEDMLLVVPEGYHAVRLGNDAFIKQSLRLVKGSYYSITFSAARTCAQDQQLNVSVSPNFGVISVQTAYSSTGWDSYSWGFQALLDTANLVIHNPEFQDDAGCGLIVDSIAIRTIYPPAASKYNLLRNPDFEEGPYMLPKSPCGVLVPGALEDNHSPLPGWIVESLKAVKYIDSDHFSVPRGKRAVELVGGLESALAQVVRTTPGRTYALSFSLGDADDGCEGSLEVEVFAADDWAKASYESKGTGGHTRSSMRFKAVDYTTRIVFSSTTYIVKSDGSLCGPVIDDVCII